MGNMVAKCREAAATIGKGYSESEVVAQMSSADSVAAKLLSANRFLRRTAPHGRRPCSTRFDRP
ncbi:hypothetical protein BQ8482_80211 [Mesorhizobium delmotii]|uniref:Uncharacterized protein n=1 Tax=Mesorhizobium delmotii TaxID=1631247 RepID=A0A2P9AWK6_9HYPH|nr:hypothetical protein BQ8482_80211 [Mesorhizobium delmotii]